MTDWSKITIVPNEEAIAALREHWHWLLGEDWMPLMFSAIGDVFFSVKAESIWWLSTATGSLEQVCDSHKEFEALLESESADEWFLPGLPIALHSMGKVLQADQCYTYNIFPVFEHGAFSVENMHAVEAAVHFKLSGQLFESIRGLPDGTPATVCLSDEFSG